MALDIEAGRGFVVAWFQESFFWLEVKARSIPEAASSALVCRVIHQVSLADNLAFVNP